MYYEVPVQYCTQYTEKFADRYMYYTWEIQPLLYKCVGFYEAGISVPMFQSVFKHRYAHYSTVEYTRLI